MTNGSIAGHDPALFARRLRLLALLALALRAAFILLEPANRIVADETTWVLWALGVREGLTAPHIAFSPFRSEMIFYPPLYPYFIASAHTLFGSLLGAKLLQAVAGAVLVLLVGRIGARSLGSRAALLAAAIIALYPELIWFAAHFWCETLFLALSFGAFERLAAADDAGAAPPPSFVRSLLTRVRTVMLYAAPLGTLALVSERDRQPGATAAFLLVMIATWLLVVTLRSGPRDGRGAALAAGLLWGLAILTRETLLYFTPVTCAWLLIRRRAGAQKALVFAAGVVLVVAPWTYRNFIVTRAFVPVATSGALNLWQGNTTLARQEVYRLTEEVRGPGHVRIAQWRLHKQRAWQAIRARLPWWPIEKVVQELPAFWEADSLVLIHLKEKGAYGPFRASTAWLLAIVVLVPYLLVLGFFPLGLAHAHARAGRIGGLLLAFLVFHTAMHLATHGFSRYRLPVLPVIVLFAAGGYDAWRRRHPLRPTARRWLLFGYILLAACVFPSLVRHARDRAFAHGGTGVVKPIHLNLLAPEPRNLGED
jgi:4-amino-4-deoxy-L-arabinose transferase-like glycosyltransferase